MTNPRLALSQPYIDIGLFTHNGEEMTRFYRDRLRLPLQVTLSPKPGHVLHRFDVNGHGLKINSVHETLSTQPTHYRRVLIPEQGRRTPTLLQDPDGNDIELVPPGYLDIDRMGIVLAVPTESMATDLALVLGATPLGGLRFRCGETILLFEMVPDLAMSGPLESHGFTYTTLRVRDVPSAHMYLLAMGFTEAVAPATLQLNEQLTLALSFVRDPIGHWIELTQRLPAQGGEGS